MVRSHSPHISGASLCTAFHSHGGGGSACRPASLLTSKHSSGVCVCRLSLSLSGRPPRRSRDCISGDQTGPASVARNRRLAPFEGRRPAGVRPSRPHDPCAVGAQTSAADRRGRQRRFLLAPRAGGRWSFPRDATRLSRAPSPLMGSATGTRAAAAANAAVCAWDLCLRSPSPRHCPRRRPLPPTCIYHIACRYCFSS